MQSELIWNDSVHILKPGREQANVTMGEILQGGKIVKVLLRGKWLLFSCFFVRKLVMVSK